MSERMPLRVLSPPDVRAENGFSDWTSSTTPVVVGKDVLELLSTSMYVDAMTIYREYIQNAADAIDDAHEKGVLSARTPGQVEIAIDAVARQIRIRDNGAGIGWPDFVERLSSLGASSKRGTNSRGFRGVGRLAGLGYCQELIFRSRVDGDAQVSELRWDCRMLKAALRSARHKQPITALVREVVSVRRVAAVNQPKRFFEVELNSVIRHRNDRLLNSSVVSEYLSQVAPIPFSPAFSYGEKIAAALGPYVRMGDLQIRINGADEPLYRPHRDQIEVGEGKRDQILDLEFRELTSVDGGRAAIAWVLHHGYVGAIPAKALIKGIRLRVGNLQVGDNSVLEDLFPEPRFNGWAIGEVHILDPKVVPNGRRDHFEQSVHFDNLTNQLTPCAREVARRCRQSSTERKWLREFELHREAALSHANAYARGGLSRSARRTHEDAVAKSLKAIQKVIVTRYIGDDARATLVSQAKDLEKEVGELLGGPAAEKDPLEHFRPQVREAYQNVISLIYELASNSSAAASLVDKILTKLGKEGARSTHKRSKRKAARTSKR